MKQNAIVVLCYALLIFVGGIIGHTIANSLASLIASSIIALILLGCAHFINKGSQAAYYAATVITALLFVFFTYRFFLSYKIAPSGIMAILSAFLVVYLFMRRKKKQMD